MNATTAHHLNTLRKAAQPVVHNHATGRISGPVTPELWRQIAEAESLMTDEATRLEIIAAAAENGMLSFHILTGVPNTGLVAITQRFRGNPLANDGNWRHRSLISLLQHIMLPLWLHTKLIESHVSRVLRPHLARLR